MENKRNCKNYNMIMKKILAGVMAFIIPTSVSACKKEDINASNNVKDELVTYIDDSFDYSKDNQKYLNDLNTLLNRKEFYEYDDLELNKLIDQIKSIEYESDVKEFNNYNLKVLPYVEMNSFIKDARCEDEFNVPFKLNYGWYQNGKVDSQKLYNQIINNTKKNNIQITPCIEKSVKVFSDNLNNLLDVVKSYDKNYDFKYALLNINDLCFAKEEEYFYNSAYSYYEDKIYVNEDNLVTEDDFKDNIIHEAMHLIFSNTYKNLSLLKVGCSIDDNNTLDCSLGLGFMNEYYTEELSTKSLGKKNTRYKEEEAMIDLICFFTDIEKNELLKIYLGGKPESLLDIFEPEFQNINYVYSIMDSIDLSCAYGNLFNESDYLTLKENFQNFAIINLLKNYSVKLIKDYKLGNISKDELNNKLENVKSKLKEERALYSAESNFEYINNIKNKINTCKIK